jgi:hypothetical protein
MPSWHSGKLFKHKHNVYAYHFDSDDVEAKEEEVVQAVLQDFLFRSCSMFVYSMFQVVVVSW